MRTVVKHNQVDLVLSLLFDDKEKCRWKEAIRWQRDTCQRQFFTSSLSGRFVARTWTISCTTYVDLRYLSKQTNVRFILFSLSTCTHLVFRVHTNADTHTRIYICLIFPSGWQFEIFPRKKCTFFCFYSSLLVAFVRV